MTLSVTDRLSNSNEHVKELAAALRRSPRLMKVFKAIFKGNSKPKPVSRLMKETGLKRVPVLQDAGKLVDMGVVRKIKVGREGAYEKDRFYVRNKNKALLLAANPKKLKALPTKYAPQITVTGGGGRIVIRGAKPKIAMVTCDDFDQFTKVKKIKSATAQRISEKAFKEGIQRLIGETGAFRDWGGERNDLFTSKLRYQGKRRPIAFAFKGPGTKGVLTPKKLGKNGDQIPRLFTSPAEIFIVQYHDQIDQSVLEDMQVRAKIKSIADGTKIWYGVIDGDDTNRLLKAYPKQFGLKPA